MNLHPVNTRIVITAFTILTTVLVLLVWASLVLFLRLRKKKTFPYLIFFSIFFLYLVKVFDYTLFQFQSLLFLKYFLPNIIVNGQPAGEAINLVPLATLGFQDVKTSVLNIILFIPFGFGLPFITNWRLKNVILTSIFFSIAIELLQFITGLMANITFRIADINDVIFNTIGALFGYGVFIGCLHVYYLFSHGKRGENAILRSISDTPQLYK